MVKTRVMVVDDSAVARRLLTEVLTADPQMEVVATADNGNTALAKLPEARPDVVILDVEMPGLDGLATLGPLRKSFPRLPVIMFSARSERGAAATLEAIARGASEYVTKPNSTDGIEGARAHIRNELLPRIRALAPCGPVEKAEPHPAPSPRKAAPVAPGPSQRVDILAIGVSTGGPTALTEVFLGLPKQFPIPVVTVMHMPPVFTRLFADQLSAKAQLPLRECQGDEVLQPGVAYLAQGGHHMVVRGTPGDRRLVLNRDPPENCCRPAVDVLFRSVVSCYGSRVLAVILTGMGQDGFRGCEAVREAGGEVFVQDQATSVVWGMPGTVARAGLANRVLPLDRVAPELVARVAVGRARFAP